MGLFDKMKDAQAQASSAMGGAQMPAAGQMGGAGQMAYAQLAQKLGQNGVEAMGVVHSIQPTGGTDFGGGQEVNFDVSIKPASGETYQTTITQSMLPAQLEGIQEGSAITVKYDPDSPTSALIFGW